MARTAPGRVASCAASPWAKDIPGAATVDCEKPQREQTDDSPGALADSRAWSPPPLSRALSGLLIPIVVLVQTPPTASLLSYVPMLELLLQLTRAAGFRDFHVLAGLVLLALTFLKVVLLNVAAWVDALFRLVLLGVVVEGLWGINNRRGEVDMQEWSSKQEDVGGTGGEADFGIAPDERV